MRIMATSLTGSLTSLQMSISSATGERSSAGTDPAKGLFFKGFAFRSGSAPPTLRRIGDNPPCQIGMPGIAVADLFWSFAQAGGMLASGAARSGLAGTGPAKQFRLSNE